METYIVIDYNIIHGCRPVQYNCLCHSEHQVCSCSQEGSVLIYTYVPKDTRKSLTSIWMDRVTDYNMRTANALLHV